MDENEKRPSSTTLTVFISLLTLILTLIATFQKDIDLIKDKKIYQIIGVILVALFITGIIHWKWINAYINKKASQFKLLNALVFEYKKGKLEFIEPDGSLAIYSEDSLLNKIKRKFIYEGTIGTSGKINPDIQTFNCYNSLNNRKDKVTIIFGKKKNNENGSLINRRQLQFGFSIIMLDTFLEEEETWDYRFGHYTKQYDLKIFFNKSNPPEYVDILEYDGEKDGKPVYKPLPTDPLTIKKKDKVVVKIKLLQVQQGKKVRIIWKWKKGINKKTSKK